MTIEHRRVQWNALENNVFEVAVIGGGINGVCLYHDLCRRGFSVLLVDKGDFACGTSQASAMMIWGGVLYLRNWDLLTVRRLCRSRDRMLREMSEWIKPRRFRYIPVHGRRHAGLARAALDFYWLLGGCRRLRPRHESDFPERAFLAGIVAARHSPTKRLASNPRTPASCCTGCSPIKTASRLHSITAPWRGVRLILRHESGTWT